VGQGRCLSPNFLPSKYKKTYLIISQISTTPRRQVSHQSFGRTTVGVTKFDESQKMDGKVKQDVWRHFNSRYVALFKFYLKIFIKIFVKK
jgi:hypothetical protein